MPTGRSQGPPPPGTGPPAPGRAGPPSGPLTLSAPPGGRGAPGGPLPPSRPGPPSTVGRGAQILAPGNCSLNFTWGYLREMVRLSSLVKLSS